jgi:hypothetical protein
VSAGPDGKYRCPNDNEVMAVLPISSPTDTTMQSALESVRPDLPNLFAAVFEETTYRRFIELLTVVWFHKENLSPAVRLKELQAILGGFARRATARQSQSVSTAPTSGSSTDGPAQHDAAGDQAATQYFCPTGQHELPEQSVDYDRSGHPICREHGTAVSMLP